MASASDNFDRANGPLGANWTGDEGVIEIVSNQADAISTAGVYCRARYTGTPMDSANHYSQALVRRQSAGITNKGGVSARQAGSANTCYVFFWNDESVDFGVGIKSLVAGTETDLAYATGVYTIDKTLRLEVNGTTIRGLLDAVQVISVTNSAVAAGTFAGLWVYLLEGLWNDFDAADLGGAVADAVVHQAIYRGVESR